MSVDLAALHAAKANGASLAHFDLKDGTQARLRAAYPPGARRAQDARFFSVLRSAHANLFFDTSRPLPAEVEQWIAKRYDSDDRQINFIVEGDRPLLFCGLSDIDPEAGTAEFGRLMRAPSAPRGVAAPALAALFRWAAGIGFSTIRLEVFSDNIAAQTVYRRLGFRDAYEFRRVPRQGDGHTLWDRGEGPDDRPVLAMELALEHQG